MIPLYTAMLCRVAHAPSFNLLGSAGVFCSFLLAPRVSPWCDVINDVFFVIVHKVSYFCL